MSDLQNLTPANTYKGLLQVGDYTDGISGDTGGNALQVTDGAGNNTALAISTDRVGIGTTSPSKELDVNGNVVADEYALDATGSSSSAVAIHAPATNELAIRTNSTEAMRIDSNGNVGIGTASPDGLLELYKASGSDGYNHLRLITGAGGGLSIGALSDDANPTWVINTNSEEPLVFSSATNEYMRIDSGNVGIGTTNPSAPLHVLTSGTDGTLVIESDDAGSDYAPDLLLFRSSTTPAVNDNLGEIKFRGKNDDDPQGNIDYTMIRSRIKDPTNNSEKGELTFWTRSGTTLYQRMTIDPDGNVGIGTTDPDTLLDVNGVASFRVPTGGKTFISWGIGDNTSVNQPTFLLRTNETNDEDRVKLNSDGDSWFNGGKLGIGTMTPSAPLEVSSTTGGVIMPRMTTTQMNAISSPTDGEMIYNTTANKFYGRANGAWVALH